MLEKSEDALSAKCRKQMALSTQVELVLGYCVRSWIRIIMGVCMPACGVYRAGNQLDDDNR